MIFSKRLLVVLLSLMLLSSYFLSSVPVSANSDDIASDESYTNVALNKEYKTSELFAIDGVIAYPDKTGKAMTDGKVASENTKYNDPVYIGFNKSTDNVANGYSSVTVDLGSIYKLDKFVAHTASSYHVGVGITEPEFVWIYLSHDNKNWYKAGIAQPENDNSKSSVACTLELEGALTARYVQYRFVGKSNWIMVCEVEAYGIETDTEIEYPDEEPSLKFLCVGNSSIYFFNTPIKFMYLAEAAGINIQADSCTIGGAYLSQYADPNDVTCGQLFRTKINANKYDYVILQDNSNADYDSSKPAMDVLMPMVKDNGATALLYKRYSSNSDPVKRINSAYKHHRNYTKLARDFSIDKVAPVADAFLICYEKYPEINLHHTDNSHHNETGAYLIACVWGITYLGIDLTDIAYTAGLDDETAAKIHDCARIACEKGYAFPQISYSENGKTYHNIAANKSYTTNGKPYANESWTDTDANGNPLGKLTDTVVATNGADSAIGCYVGNEVDFIIDLEKEHTVKSVRVDFYGREDWYINKPSDTSVKVAVSNDGKEFTDIGTAAMSEVTVDNGWDFAEFNLITDSDDITAKYVRVTYINTKGNDSHFWTSDIRVFGEEMSAQKDEEISEAASEETTNVSEAEANNGLGKWLWAIVGAVAAAAVAVVAIVRKKK